MFNLVRVLYLKGIWNNYNLGLGFYAQIEDFFFFFFFFGLWTLINKIEYFRLKKKKKKRKKKRS